jgi:3-methylcrotonyl-CoA carboxylase alpha subunit
MGIETVAVYSDADAEALHVQMADQAAYLGASEPSASYLDGQKIVAIALQTGADAIHPGYGFLSERDSFAESVRQAGLIFIGPSPEAMRLLGRKIEAKVLAGQAGVPLVPGCFEPGADDARLIAAAMEIGLPVMLKASAGGGGRGMRAVHKVEDLESQLRLARDEAIKGFGDGAMMVEKLIERPRHIEVQILADSHGGVATLFERECSVQRRHQKLIEEAPSPVMSDALWHKMRTAAERLIRAANYVGAGTVEFIVNREATECYYLEVNARLQVEHPVTEEITGLDLVRQQILIASGLPMEVPERLMTGDRSAIRGHAIEVRIVAEDPAHGFLPSIGMVEGWAPPFGPGIRWDSGMARGHEVTRFYDSMIAKLICAGSTRSAAITRAIHALQDTHVLGVHTSIGYSLDILESGWFQQGDMDTGALEREMGDWRAPEPPKELAAILAADHGAPRLGPSAASARWAWGVPDSFRNVRASESA